MGGGYATSFSSDGAPATACMIDLLGDCAPLSAVFATASLLAPGSLPSAPPSHPMGSGRTLGRLPGYSGATAPDSHRLPRTIALTATEYHRITCQHDDHTPDPRSRRSDQRHAA